MEIHHGLKHCEEVSKCVIKITGLRDGIPSKMVTFHEQRAITPEGMVRYGPLSNLK